MRRRGTGRRRPIRGPALPADERALLEAFDRLRPQGTLRWNFDDAVRRLTEPPEAAGRLSPWGGLPGRPVGAGPERQGQRAGAGRRGQDRGPGPDRVHRPGRRRAAAAGRRGPGRAATPTLDAVRFLAARVERLESAADPLGIAAGELDLPAPDTVGVGRAGPRAGPAADAGLPVVGRVSSGTGRWSARWPAPGSRWTPSTPGAAVRVGGRGPIWPEPGGRVDRDPGRGGGPPAAALAAGQPGLRGPVRLRRPGRDLAGKVELVDEAVRVLAPGGTLVLLVTDQAAWDAELDPVARDLLPGRPLHPETWRVVLAHRGLPGAEWSGRRATGTVHAVVAEVGAMSGIHLFVPMLHRRDAVGEHTRSLRDRLRGRRESTAGSTSRSPTRTPSTRPGPTSTTSRTPGPATCSSTRWPPGRTWSAGCAAGPEPVVLNYHSITPPRYFVAAGTTGSPATRWRPPRTWPTWRRRAALGIGVSEFDAGGTPPGAGCRRGRRSIPVANVPMPPVPARPGDAGRARARRPAAARGGCRWAGWPPTRATRTPSPPCSWPGPPTDPDARLTIVGSPSEPAYARALRRYAGELGLAGAVDVRLRAHRRRAGGPLRRRPTCW